MCDPAAPAKGKSLKELDRAVSDLPLAGAAVSLIDARLLARFQAHAQTADIGASGIVAEAARLRSVRSKSGSPSRFYRTLSLRARFVPYPASISLGLLSVSPGGRFRTASGNRLASQRITSFTVTTPIGRRSASTSGTVRYPATLIEWTA